MKQQNPNLVQEALLVSNELIRFSILWKEKWRRGLDDAYRHYLDRNIHSMWEGRGRGEKEGEGKVKEGRRGWWRGRLLVSNELIRFSILWRSDGEENP
jgi:hypothetical protein